MGIYPEVYEIYTKTILKKKSTHRGGGGIYMFPGEKGNYWKVRGLLVTYITKEDYKSDVERDSPDFEHLEVYSGNIELKGHIKKSVMEEFINKRSKQIITQPPELDL